MEIIGSIAGCYRSNKAEFMQKTVLFVFSDNFQF